FSQIILNHAQKAFSSFPRKTLLQIPQELPRGMGFRQAVRQLANLLKTKSDLYGSGTLAPAAVQAVEDLRTKIQPKLLHAMEKVHGPNGTAVKAVTAEIAEKALRECLAEDGGVASSRGERERLYHRVMDEVLGLGPLEPL